MNGIIRKKLTSAFEIDDDGNPIGQTASFGSEIPCKYVSASRNDVFDAGNGIFAQASFIITLTEMDFEANNVQLINSRNQIVCEKDVKSLEVLETIGRIKIIL